MRSYAILIEVGEAKTLCTLHRQITVVDLVIFSTAIWLFSYGRALSVSALDLLLQTQVSFMSGHVDLNSSIWLTNLLTHRSD